MNKKIDLTTDLNGLILKNPITVASGTFGYGQEYSEFIDLNRLGAITVKGLTIEEKNGNPSPRMVETPMGLINSVGLQNPGVDYFIENELGFLENVEAKIIANINGNTIDEYLRVLDKLNNTNVDSIEVNISCPNVKAGGMAFGRDPKMVYEITSKVRQNTNKHVIIKLSPNVTDIKEIAKACQDGGANCISLINTLLAMSIDIDTEMTHIARGVGGLSGPAIKPIAVRMVNEVYNSVDIPIIGMGGICNYRDAVEFMLAGARGISVGTANFVNPKVTMDILEDLEKHFMKKEYTKLDDIVGKVKIPNRA